MAERFTIQNSGSIDIIELALPQHLDFNEFDRLIEGLNEAINGRAAGKWVVDLARVEYTGSAVLGLLVNLRQQIKSHGGSLILCGMSQRLSDILHACSLDRLFRTAATRAAALKVS